MRLELRDITKRFPGVLANDKISISADRGKVLGLLGENGAGKTTLMNILSGLYKPDSGQIFIDGEERVFDDPGRRHPRRASAWSTSTSCSSRCSTSSRPSRWAPRPSATRSGPSIGPRRGKRIVELSDQYKLDVDPDAKIESLPVGVRQRVEILKALYRQSDILVLDEPSAVLTPFETEELFGIIRSLTATGTTIIFITHKLNEVLEVADNIVVLRRGRVAGTADPKTTTRQELANMMVGRDVELIVPKGPAKPGRRRPQRPRRCTSATTASRWRSNGVDLEVRAGEIVVDRRRPGQRPDRARRGDHRPALVRLRRDRRSAATTSRRRRRARSPTSASPTSRRTAVGTG